MTKPNLSLRPSGTAPELLSSYVALLNRCFPAAKHFSVSYLEWLYRDNPAGRVIGLDAWDGERLGAHYACIPAEAVVAGVPSRVLLSLNTATDPDFQGRGLFTRLAEATYEAGALSGFRAVYGVANANSTPGFIRKLGFDLVGPLDARVGVGRLLGDDLANVGAVSSFSRIWTPEMLAWRIASPVRSYRLVQVAPDVIAAQAPTGKPLLHAWAELCDGAGSDLPKGPATPGFRLHLGLAPEALRRRHSTWVNVPERLRSSPLNLIFRSLADDMPSVDRNTVLFGQLDFDAF